MVVCAVYGCFRRSGRDKCSFYRFPRVSPKYKEKTNALQAKRLALWILRLGREDFDETKTIYNRICDNHFISGAPAKRNDTTNPDWAPCINLGHNFFEPVIMRQLKWYEDVSKIVEASSHSQNEGNSSHSQNEDNSSHSQNEDNSSYSQNEDNSKDTDEDGDLLPLPESLNSETTDEQADKNSQERIKVFVFDSKKSENHKKNTAITHEEALVSARTLFRYIIDQDDTDNSFICLLIDNMIKIREKIIAEA